MGKKDDTMYEYLAQHDKFADLVNVVLYEGEPVITPSMLEPEDTRYVKKAGNGKSVRKTNNRYRDLKKRLKSGGGIGVIAIENQENVDYTMPLRIMEYDCLEYYKQVNRIRQWKTSQIKAENKVPCDWNTRLTEVDKVHPVQTICLYHGAEEWIGPKSLKDMVNWKDAPPGWEYHFHDYGMTLFCVNHVEDFSVFQTELGQLLQAISCKNDGDKLQALFQEEGYHHLERETAEAIAVMIDNYAILNNLDQYEEDGGYNMCKGLDDWAKKEQQKGKTEGKIEGKIETLILSIKNLMQNMKITAEEAMEALGVPIEERADYLAKL